MISAAESRAIAATAVAWLASSHVQASARRPLLERLDILTRPYAGDANAGELVNAVVLRIRAPDVGLDVADANRALQRAIFDFFLARSEEAVRAAQIDPATMKALGIQPGNDKAA